MSREFTVWKLDNKVRPCFGTKEIPPIYRCQVSETGKIIQKRVIAILETLKGAGIRLDIDGAMTYSNKKWMNSTDGFHIKYAMPSETYLGKFWPRYYEEIRRKLKDPDDREKPNKDVLDKNFAIDYYGKYLRLLCGYKEKDVEYIDKKSREFCRANDSLLIDTGPVVLWKMEEPLTCDKLKDDHLSYFEKMLVAIFGSGTTDDSEDFGFSVCIFVTEHNESPSKAKICIGAKIDETRFIETMKPSASKDFKKEFLRRHKYVEKVIIHQSKRDDTE